MAVARECSAKVSSDTLRRARTAAWLVLVCTARASSSFAEAPMTETRAGERRVVVLDAAPGEGIDQELEATLAELLGRLQVGLVRAEGVSGARVVALVRLESSERGAVLTVESGRHDMPPVRREVERGDSPALFRETLAHVILGAIEPLVGRENDPDRAPPPLPPPVATTSSPPVDHDRPREPLRLVVGARAGPRMLETDRAGIAFGGTVSLTLPMALRPSVGLHAGYVLPARASADDVDAEFHLVPLRAEVRIQPIAWESVALETALLGGVDFVDIEPSTISPAIGLGGEGERHRVQPMLGGAVGGRFRLSPSADFVITAGLDVDTSPRKWDVHQNFSNRNDALFEMARIRPYAALGLDFTMLGVTTGQVGAGSP